MTDADSESINWGAWEHYIVIAGLLVGVVSLLVAIASWAEARSSKRFTQLSNEKDDLEKDASYRQEIVDHLRREGLGISYRRKLEQALNWLDKVFDQPGSANALGVCILIAMIYAYVSYFIGWGMGGSASIGGHRMPLPDGATQPNRGIAGFILVIVPIITFYLSRGLAYWLSYIEAWIKRLRIWRWTGLWLYRVISVITFFTIFASLAHYAITSKKYQIIIDSYHFNLAVFPLIGGLFGYFCAKSCRSNFLSAIISSGGGIIVGLCAFVAAPGDRRYLLPILLVSAISLGGVFTVALVIAMACVIVEISTKYGGIFLYGGVANKLLEATQYLEKMMDKKYGVEMGGISDNIVLPQIVAYIGMIIVIGISGIGASTGVISSQDKSKGIIWAGGIGTLAGMGIALTPLGAKKAEDDMTLFFLLFFLILPIINGLFDWLSWWAARWLGRRLLTVLVPEHNAWQRGWAILGYSLADLSIAAGLLLAMAFGLAFGFNFYNEFAKLKNHQPVFPGLRDMIDHAAASGSANFWLLAMLLTTLLPSLGHAVVLLGSPLGVFFITDRKRQELAGALDSYETAGEKKASILRRTAQWIVFEEKTSLFAAFLLLIVMCSRLPALYYALTKGKLYTIVINAASLGLDFAQWLGKILLGID